MGERRKVRVRWYGETFGGVTAPKLEVKVRHGAVGEKYSYDFPPFVLGEGFSQQAFQGIVQGSDLPDGVRRQLRSLQVVLANRYLRWYYASRDGRWERHTEGSRDHLRTSHKRATPCTAPTIAPVRARATAMMPTAPRTVPAR